MLAVACFALFKANKSLNDENTRLGSNQKALLDKATYYQTEAGKSAASVQKLELSYEELKDNYQDICNVADELGISVPEDIIENAVYLMRDGVNTAQ